MGTYDEEVTRAGEVLWMLRWNEAVLIARGGDRIDASAQGDEGSRDVGSAADADRARMQAVSGS
jgi:hypothetical protein